VEYPHVYRILGFFEREQARGQVLSMSDRTIMAELERGERLPVIRTQARQGTIMHERSGGVAGLLWANWATEVFELAQPARFVNHAVGALDYARLATGLYWKNADGDIVEREQVPPGSVFAQSQQLVNYARWHNVRMSVVTFSNQFLEVALPEPLTRRPVELQPIIGAEPDPRITRLVHAMGREVEKGLLSERLFFEDMGSRLALYVVTRFALYRPRIRPIRERRRWQLARVFEYIEDNLNEDLSTVALAAAVSMDCYQLRETFRVITGEALHRYVVRRRLARACLLLRDSRRTLASIAEDVGFSSQAHFTQSFRSHYKVTPGAYRSLCT
jgi:AraC-like DNA-binding protein